MPYENYNQKSNINRFNESSYNIMEIIQRRRVLRNATATTTTSNTSLNASKATSVKPNQANSCTQQNKSNSSSTQQNKSNSGINQLNKSNSSSAQQNKSNCKPVVNQQPKQPNQPADKQSTTNDKAIVNLPKSELEIESRQDFLYDILKWNTIWFKNSTENPASLCEEQAQPLKLNYSSVDEYIAFYKPLVLYEIWAQIAERVEALKKSSPCKVSLFINSYEAEDNFLVLNCVLPVTNDDFSTNSYPIEGDLLVIEINILKKQTETEKLLLFGYVSEYVVDEITEKTMLSKKIVYPSTCKKLLRYIIKLKSMNVKIDMDTSIRCSSIYYLKSKLRQCEALTNLDRSALCNGIIRPESQLLPIKINHQLKSDGKFNTSQLNVIYNTNELVNGSAPGILLVQGPPGTGKLIL